MALSELEESTLEVIKADGDGAVALVLRRRFEAMDALQTRVTALENTVRCSCPTCAKAREGIEAHV